MGRFLLGILAGFGIVVVCSYLYFRLGFAPVATAASPMPFETFIAKTGLHAQINSVEPGPSPVPASPANELAGAQLYQQHCAMCHGTPGSPAAVATAMFPHPPQLFKGKGVTDDPETHVHWIVENGIRLSGMPAFKKLLTDPQLWQLVDLLHNANNLPPDVQSQLTQAKESGKTGG
jgi:thiosulfate dehydrogenase